MILVDTSVWIAHLGVSKPTLEDLLSHSLVLSHPFVIGEIALGDARQRKAILDLTQNLSRAIVATDEEVLLFIEQHALPGRGIGYVDAHLSASTWLTAGAKPWTHDRRLHEAWRDLVSASFGTRSANACRSRSSATAAAPRVRAYPHPRNRTLAANAGRVLGVAPSAQRTVCSART